jgi:uncharacterized protein (TIGR02996 family)
VTTAEAFLTAILDAPDDDAPRLMAADYLEEQGDARAPSLRSPGRWEYHHGLHGFWELWWVCTGKPHLGARLASRCSPPLCQGIGSHSCRNGWSAQVRLYGCWCCWQCAAAHAARL